MACSVVKVLAVSSALALATTCDAFLTAPSLRPATSTLRAAGSRQGRCSTVAPSMVLTPDRRTASAPTGFGDNARQPPAKVSTCARAAPRCHRNKILAAPLCKATKSIQGYFQAEPHWHIDIGHSRAHERMTSSAWHIPPMHMHVCNRLVLMHGRSVPSSVTRIVDCL